MRRAIATLIVPVALLVAACGSSSSSTTSGSAAAAPTTSTSTAPTVSIATRTLPGLGTVLVNGQGRTLYVFAPDKAKRVTCVSGCAAVWPPLKIGSGQKPAASAGVEASLLSSDADPSGGQVVTYAGWPLYLYVADPSPGTDHGQALSSSGGLWYVITPSGTVIKKKPSSASTGGATY